MLLFKSQKIYLQSSWIFEIMSVAEFKHLCIKYEKKALENDVL